MTGPGLGVSYLSRGASHAAVRSENEKQKSVYCKMTMTAPGLRVDKHKIPEPIQLQESNVECGTDYLRNQHY